MCHGPSQSESNFINTVIKQEGNYSKYWKNVRVIHELRGDRVLFDTQGINDAKEIYSEIVCTVPPASQLSRPARAPNAETGAASPLSAHPERRAAGPATRARTRVEKTLPRRTQRSRGRRAPESRGRGPRTQPVRAHGRSPEASLRLPRPHPCVAVARV